MNTQCQLCPVCNGAGVVGTALYHLAQDQSGESLIECQSCGGTGVVWLECAKCNKRHSGNEDEERREVGQEREVGRQSLQYVWVVWECDTPPAYVCFTRDGAWKRLCELVEGRDWDLAMVDIAEDEMGINGMSLRAKRYAVDGSNEEAKRERWDG